MCKSFKWFGSSTDIHDEKEANLKLKVAMEEYAQTNKELSRVNNILNNFVYIAAHDLRSPVTNLKMIFDLLKEEKDYSKKDELIRLVNRSVERLDKTVTGLVEVIDNESIIEKSDVLDFRLILLGIIADLSPVYPEIDSCITSDFSVYPVISYVEPYLISIMKNIISNAYKYQSPKRRLDIKIKTEKDDGLVKLTISDNGRGFDMNYGKNIIFKPFKRLTHEGEGKGVGLFLVKNIVEKNGGKIEVNSYEDLGTTFYVYLNEY